MKNMFNVTTTLSHNLLQTNSCIRHNFSTQVFRKRAAQLHYVGPELLVPNEEHVQCDHHLANELLHSSQLFDTSLQKNARHNFTMWTLSCATFSGLFWPPKEARKGIISQSMRINSVLDVKCFCNNKNLLCAQSML